MGQYIIGDALLGSHRYNFQCQGGPAFFLVKLVMASVSVFFSHTIVARVCVSRSVATVA